MAASAGVAFDIDEPSQRRHFFWVVVSPSRWNYKVSRIGDRFRVHSGPPGKSHKRHVVLSFHFVELDSHDGDQFGKRGWPKLALKSDA